MKALSFWKAVTLDKSNLLDKVFALLYEHGVRFCVIGGQAVNAYVEPLVSLDLDLAVAVGQVDEVRQLMEGHFKTEVFPHSINVSSVGFELARAVSDRSPVWRLRWSVLNPRGTWIATSRRLR